MAQVKSVINNIAGLVPGAPGANFGIRDKSTKTAGILPDEDRGRECCFSLRVRAARATQTY